MATDPVDYLKALALRGANRDFIPITSSELADELDVSQQTASRKILELLNRDLIDRRLGARVQMIKITDDGMGTLRDIYEDFRAIFEEPDRVRIHGKAESGVGEGKYYIQREGYLTQFDQRLGFKPYPGTFNVRVPDRERGSLSLLRNESGIPIEPFETADRTFGAAKCFPALIEETECAVILPERTHHEGVLELISPKHLRSALSIQDGDPVEVLVKLLDDPAANGR